MSCSICHSSAGLVHTAREMMFGTREQFRYWECSDCGCLSLMDIPADLGKYYPQNYYSLNGVHTSTAKRLRDRLYLSPLSLLVNWRSRMDLDVVRRSGLTRSKSLLDVGCGSGYSVTDLRQLGYKAEGIEPFVKESISDEFGTRVHKGTLTDITGQWDVITFLHSLEHVPNQLETMTAARDRLTNNGICVVCIPIVGWAWKHYGVNWVQLDAPRHFFIHSVKSLTKLAIDAGFRVDRVIHDSTDFQFWVSESYTMDIDKQHAPIPDRWERFLLNRHAKRLNGAKQGDQAQFYLSLA